MHTCFRTTICRVLALTTISSWHSMDPNTVGAFISSTLTYSKHLYMKAPACYNNDWGTALERLCKELTSTCASFPFNIIFFFVKSSALLLCLVSDWCPFVKHHRSIHAHILLIIGNFSQHGFLAARLHIVLSSCGCDDPCNVRRQ